MYEGIIYIYIVIGLCFALRKKLKILVKPLCLGIVLSLIFNLGSERFSFSKSEVLLSTNDNEIVSLASAEGFPLGMGLKPQPTRRLFGSSSNPSGSSGAGSGSGKPSTFGPTEPPSPRPGPFFTQPSGKKSETKAEKKERELKESIAAKKELNNKRKKDNQPLVTLMIKDGKRWFAKRSQIRDKFYHFPDVFGSDTPASLPIEELNRLANNVPYSERLKVLRSDKLPEKFVEAAGSDLRKACLDPNTVVKPGTFGKNMEARGVGKSTEGYIFYNEKTKQAFFFDSNGFRTAIKPNPKQMDDIKDNNNML